jgi:hypothetical protein
MPGLRTEGATCQGSLWTRAGSPVWQSVFARLQQDRMLIYSDEAAVSPSAAVPLRGAQISEFSMHTGGRTHMFERAFRIIGGQENSSEPAGVFALPNEHIFAAHDGVSHLNWQSELASGTQQRCPQALLHAGSLLKCSGCTC